MKIKEKKTNPEGGLKRKKSYEKVFQQTVEKIDTDLVLEVKNLTKIYPLGDYKVKALNNVNLQIKKGEFIAVVGPSGSGKTTLINCLGALDFPNEGKIVYNIDGKGTGSDITQMNDREHKEMRLHRIGLIFQFYNLFPILTAFENVELPAILAEVPEKNREERVKRLLKIVGLDQRMYHLPTQMSGGEQQRVTIARSLVNEPLILLADEPTGELDTETTTQIIEIFLKFKALGQSILMVTHNTRIAETADRILTLRDGKITEERKGGRSIREIWYDSGGKIQ